MNASSCGRERGVALIAALWLLVLMSIIASALAWSNRRTVQSMASAVGGIQARYLADGAFQLVIANLLQRDQKQRLLGDGEVLRVNLPGGEVVMQLYDESGKVDINRATPGLLARLLYSLDIDPSVADKLADAIADYRDQDDLRHLNGAEDSDYAAAGLSWRTKGSDFADITELRKVLGMDTELYERIQQYVTVYSRQKGINPDVATLPVLMAASGASKFVLQSYIDRRRKNRSDGVPLPDPPAIAPLFFSRVRGVTFTLSAVGRTDRGQIAGLSTAIRLRRGLNSAIIQTLALKPYLNASAGENQLFDQLSQ